MGEGRIKEVCRERREESGRVRKVGDEREGEEQAGECEWIIRF